MKLAKMSMVAALLLGANAYAIENVKVSGDAKLYYSTDDSETVNGDGGLFNKTSSAGQVALNIGLTADLTEGVSAGVAMTGLTAHGLQNNLVSNVWEAQDTLDGGDYWFSEAWMATTMGQTTAKIGRQTIDSPLLFTETWSIAQNTFDAGVLINQDIADTTLVGAYIGSSNFGTAGAFSNVAGAPVNGEQGSRYQNVGAYAIGVVNNSMKELTLQAWYYSHIQTRTAMWLSADLNMEGILAGIQYANEDSATAGIDTGDIMSVMLGYEMKDVATFKVAYSQTDDTVGAGKNLTGQQTKVYTEMWWNYGTVVAADTSAILLSAEATVSDVDLFASYVMSSNDTDSTQDLNELAISASKSYGPVDTSVVFINTDRKVPAVAALGAENMLQVYLTYNF